MTEIAIIVRRTTVTVTVDGTTVTDINGAVSAATAAAAEKPIRTKRILESIFLKEKQSKEKLGSK